MTVLRFQYAEALILMHIARVERWLLAHHSVAGNLAIFADRVVNIPVPREQLNRVLAHVFDPDEVGEDIATQDRLRLLFQIQLAHVYLDALPSLVLYPLPPPAPPAPEE